MATVASLRGSAHPVICEKCGDRLVAPEWAEYFSEEQLILNLWSCMRCGNRFETEAFVAADCTAENEKKAAVEFYPSLVA